MTYKAEQDKSVAGAIANTENSNLISRTVEVAEGIAFGVPVVQGANDKGVRLPATGDTQFVGITVLDRTAGDLVNGKFKQYESARVLDRGVIWVEVSEAVNAGDAVTVDLANAKFNKSGTAFANAKYDTSAEANGLAQVRLK